MNLILYIMEIDTKTKIKILQEINILATEYFLKNEIYKDKADANTILEKIENIF